VSTGDITPNYSGHKGGILARFEKIQRTPYFRYKLAKHITSLALPDVQLQPSNQNCSSDTGYPNYDLSYFSLFPQEKSRDNISNYVTTASFQTLPQLILW
jgi:hypothetical protein